MISELITSFTLNFFAELGDKTQLAALMLASKYSFSKVFLGIAIAVFLLQAIAVIGGAAAKSLIPSESITSLIAGTIFLIFGIFIFKESESENRSFKLSSSPFLASFLVFFWAELGDKTQLATMVKTATSHFPFATYIGASLGLLASNSIGMLIGQFAKGRISEKTLRFFGAFIFICFGLYYILTAVRKLGLI